MTKPEIEALAEQRKARPETGTMKFGDDWPGVFIRGDEAKGFCVILMNVLHRRDQREPPHHDDAAELERLRDILADTDATFRGYEPQIQRVKAWAVVLAEPKPSGCSLAEYDCGDIKCKTHHADCNFAGPECWHERPFGVSNDPVQYATMALEIAYAGRMHWPTMVTAVEWLLDKHAPGWRERVEVKEARNVTLVSPAARVLDQAKEIQQLQADLSTAQTQLAEMRAAVEQLHRDGVGHNHCWRNIERFFERVGLVPRRAGLPPRAEFEAGCKSFQDAVYADPALYPDFIVVEPK